MATNFKKYFKVQPDNLSKNEWIFLSIATIIVLAFGYFLFNYAFELKREKKEFKENSNYKITTAEATSYIMRRSRTLFYYEVKGEIYRHHLPYSSDKVLLGETFKIKYKPSRPYISILEFESPIIEKTDFALTTGNIIELNENQNRVNVKYSVDSIEYERWIFVNSLNKFELKKNYELIFNIKQPEIAYFSYFLK